jgi:hypothetical protein
MAMVIAARCRRSRISSSISAFRAVGIGVASSLDVAGGEPPFSS